MKFDPFKRYQQAVPEGGEGTAAPASGEPASNEVIADVDWGSVTNDAPGADDQYDDRDSNLPNDSPPEGQPPASSTTPPPAAPPVETPPPAPPVAPPPAPPQPSAEEIAAGQEQLRKNITAELEKRYASVISEDDARELALNPEKVMPKLMAQAVMDAVNSMQIVLQQQLPKTIEETTRQSTVKQQAAAAFFKDNADLAKPEYRTALDQATQMFRATHPNATREEAIKGVAKIARVALGLPDPAASPTPPQTKAPSTRPAAFVPVAAGGSSRPGPSGGRPKTVWDDLID